MDGRGGERANGMSQGGDLFGRIAQVKPELSRAETRVADHILAAPQDVVGKTVAQLAADVGVSQATVVRLSQSLGYSGYPDMRIELAQAVSRTAVERERSNVAEGELSPDDSVQDVVLKLAFHEARSIEETARRLDLEALERAADALARAPRAIIGGVGASGLVAQDLGQKLQRIGRPAFTNPDVHVQLQHAALLGPGDVAVGISFSGRTSEIRRLLDVAKQHGALTVAITNVPNSPVGRAAETVLATSAHELPLRVGAFSSRMAQLAVVDMVFVRVAQRHYASAIEAQRRTYEAVAPTKLAMRSSKRSDA